MYKIRVILDTKEDVIRTISVNNTISLESLHNIIAKSFGFNGQEMASFYKTDAEWNQGDEIPLFNMSDDEDSLSMHTCVLENTLTNNDNKLIYLYDFLALWTFYVEVIDINSTKSETQPTLLLSVGEIPEKAPEKEFKSENLSLEKEEDEDDFFDDNFDFNQY